MWSLQREKQNILNKLIMRYLAGCCSTPNAIKNHAFELLYGEKDTNILLDKLEKLFLTNPTRYRLNKPSPPRKNSSSKSLLNYFKRLRKVCF
jgi:hypothetical protein